MRATLEAESAVRLRETHTELEAFGRKFDLPAALQYTRQLCVAPRPRSRARRGWVGSPCVLCSTGGGCTGARAADSTRRSPSVELRDDDDPPPHLSFLPSALTPCTNRRYVTYVDEELLVVKDESGIADILLRKAFNDFGLDEGVPSVADDDLAPGAG